jgi:hypothetical protein
LRRLENLLSNAVSDEHQESNTRGKVAFAFDRRTMQPREWRIVRWALRRDDCNTSEIL